MSSISQERVLEIANKHSEIYASLGIHPEEVTMNKKIEQQLDSIIDLIKQNKQNICAIGEIGLDHHFVKDKELYPLQKTIFNKMLLLAQDLELPVNLHTKGAEKIVFDTLPSYKIPNVNIHWYSGPENYLKLGMDRGYYFSITPAISYSPVVKKVLFHGQSFRTIHPSPCSARARRCGTMMRLPPSPPYESPIIIHATPSSLRQRLTSRNTNTR